MRPGDSFDKLELAMMCFAEDAENHYRVYSNHDEFVLIEASTANEAIHKSGIAHPYKVVHMLYKKPYILDDKQIYLNNSAEDNTHTENTEIQ